MNRSLLTLQARHLPKASGVVHGILVNRKALGTRQTQFTISRKTRLLLLKPHVFRCLQLRLYLKPRHKRHHIQVVVMPSLNHLSPSSHLSVTSFIVVKKLFHHALHIRCKVPFDVLRITLTCWRYQYLLNRF